jgi:hypothetical protein
MLSSVEEPPRHPKKTMTGRQPKTRTEATEPDATRHLDPNQKKALDLHADAAHTDGPQREKLTRKIEKLGGAPSPQTRRPPLSD